MRWSGSKAGFASAKGRLRIHRALNRIDRASKLGKHTIPAVFAMRPRYAPQSDPSRIARRSVKPLQRADLIGAHETAIALHVCREDSHQPPLHPLFGQIKPLKSEIQPGSSKHVGLLSG